MVVHTLKTLNVRITEISKVDYQIVGRVVILSLIHKGPFSP